MFIRAYAPSDAFDTAALFYQTVHSVNARDYTQRQLDAWAQRDRDVKAWNDSLLQHTALVALEEDVLVGFGDIHGVSGYLDRLYVHRDYQRRQVATTLCRRLEALCTAERIFTYASLTARPFFEKMGYSTVRRNTVIRQGVALDNYLMEKLRGTTGQGGDFDRLQTG